ncbi:MAG: DUF2752 domain-containing protein [Bacteroidetes bacterium]|nr:DUF2752 domain-containing protein [Bacteroidota bacterium]
MSSALNRNKLYLILLLACFAGYGWVYYNYAYNLDNFAHGINTCIIKQVTGIPCPSCGATRSIISLLQNNLAEALYWNPIGIILVIIMTISPIWIVFDYLRKKDSLYIFYRRVEMLFRNKYIAGIAIFLILANWIWNIQKGL